MEPPSQPGSPAARLTQRQSGSSIRSPRSTSRMSIASSRQSISGPIAATPRAASRASDEDSKTAVKVAIRVRPPLQPTDPGFDLIPQRFRGSTCEVPSPSNLIVASPQGKKLFVFDRVFDENTTQEGVWNYLSDSVNSFVQGYNVSILAYGQSGSGKSYSMGTGGLEQMLDSSHAGVIPRAGQAIFEKLQGHSQPKTGLKSPHRYSTQGIQGLKKQPNVDNDWELRATYVEIYNEHLHDLLVPESVPQADRAQVSIREDTKGRILLTGLVQHPIKSVDDLLHVLEFGSAIRQTDATAINAKSSRSHAVFSLNLVQRNKTSPRDRRLSVPLEAMSNVESNVTIDSKLHFVDLAGSERLKNTGAQGERAKEGISINAGLASLGKVISQLSSKQTGGYISYRDSRLTRLLQDSLGGNAITYMLACVTPAEFHLSETLNTVTYAQRARAIQSKPEIQRTQEDKDSPARIERLQAEVSFLREQIKRERSSEKERPSSNGNRLDERREAELQNQLMDMQESYNALSQRHARLIAEISRAREQPDEDMPTVREVIGDRAVERLKRSNSLSEAVEQVVEEYEKTIQSLESSLCNTRSSLSNTESTLMERESKIAYMENLAQQLQARLHKAVDRENNNDAYLRDLETQIENTTTSEEKSTSLIASLRKELARVKENETNSEEYITELEGRLAEAEQDQEIMKREIDRLENVIQRQRSIGRLDNLLAELDGIKQTEIDAKITRAKQTNGHVKEDSDHDEEEAIVALNKVRDEEAELNEGPEASPEGEAVPDEVAEKIEPAHAHPSIAVQQPTRPQSRDEQQAAQSNFMADKLETTMQELFDLRSEHEATMNEKEDLQRKYEHVLETLAKFQEGGDQKSAEPSQEESFLEHAGVNTRVGGQEPTSSSRSLESELSSSLLGTSTLAEELNKSTETSTEGDFDDDTEDTSFAIESSGPHDRGEASLREEDGSLVNEIESLRKKHLEQQERVKELTSTYAELQQNHEVTLGQLDSAKAEVIRISNSLRPASPGMRSPTLRRKLSQDLMSSMGNTDRATRSFASLRNIALDNFESNIDVRQNFELNLNTIMTELHDRSQKVEALDAEFQKTKKEIESKQQIILGLTRERKSLHASTNVDITVVGQMQNQLEQSEQELRSLQEAHTAKEQDWQKKYHELTRQLEEHRAAVSEKPADNDGEDEQSKFGGEDPASEHLSQIARLEKELAGWEAKHNDALSNMKASEAALLATIATLEASTTEIENVAQEINERHAAAKSSFEQERIKHQEIVADLQMEIDEYRSASEKYAEQLSKLEHSHAAILKQVDEESKTKELTQKELETHRELVSNLESQLDSHKATIAVHEANLETLLGNLKAAHTEEIERIKEDAAITAEREASDKHDALIEEHEAAMRGLEEQHKIALSLLQQELERRKEDIEELLSGASALLGHETDVGRFHGHLSEALARESNSNTNEWQQKHAQIVGEKEALQRDREAVQQELSTTLAKCADLEDRVGELMMLNSETMQKLEQTTQNELKSSRLVQELEEQLTSNYDEHEAAKNRLSSMTERQMQLEEAYHAKSEMDKELEDARLKISLLESQLTDLRRRSLQSTSRDSVNRDSGLAPAAPSFNRDSLSPEAAAIALARVSSYEPAYNSPMLRSTPTSAPSAALPSPPPAIPLPPLPNSPPLANPMLNGSIDARTRSDSPSNGTKSRSPPGTPSHGYPPPSMWTTLPQPPASSNSGNSTFSGALPDPGLAAKMEEQESRIRTIEKHLFAEKQLTATLEEALVDLENSQNKSKQDTDAWKKKCKELEDELVGLRKEKSSNRASLQQVEEEREMRVRAERARMALEERMKELNTKDGKKKKKGALNCF